MKRQNQLFSALVLGASVAIGLPAAGQQEDQREEQSEQQQQQTDQQREQQEQQRDQQQRQQEAQQDQQRPDQPPRPGETSDQRPDDPQRARGDQQQQQSDQQERQRRAMLGVAFAQGGQSRQGQEGRQQQDGRQQEGQRQGLEIAAIMPGGAAEQANLRQGDSIVSINGQQVRSAEEVDRIVQQRSVGDTLDLVILRDGERQETQVTLQAAPERDDRAGQGSRRPDFDQGARASRGWLGVTLDTQNERTVGATIERVYPAGPAARAGLRQGDRIVQVTGREVSGYQDVLQALSDTRPGDSIELTVDSNGQRQQVSVRLDDAGVFAQGDENFDSSTMWRDQSGRTGQIPEHDMMLEQHRRFAEQHERIENLLREVQRDIQEIKRQMNGQSAGQPDQPNGIAPRQPAGQASERPEGQAPQRPDDVQQPPQR